MTCVYASSDAADSPKLSIAAAMPDSSAAQVWPSTSSGSPTGVSLRRLVMQDTGAHYVGTVIVTRQQMERRIQLTGTECLQAVRVFARAAGSGSSRFV